MWEFKQGNNAMETAEKICSVYGEGTITDRAVQNWFVKFCSGDTSLTPGRSLDFNAEALKSLVECNAHQSTRELADKLNTSQSAIGHQLEKWGKSASWVSGFHMLSVKRTR